MIWVLGGNLCALIHRLCSIWWLLIYYHLTYCSVPTHPLVQYIPTEIGRLTLNQVPKHINSCQSALRNR